MPSAAEEARLLRRRHDDLLLEIDRGDSPPDPGNPSIVVKTVTVASYPGSPGVFFGVQRSHVGGTEGEGNAVTFTDITGTFYAMNLGTSVPPVGTYVIADLVDGRWVFRYDG